MELGKLRRLSSLAYAHFRDEIKTSTTLQTVYCKSLMIPCITQVQLGLGNEGEDYASQFLLAGAVLSSSQFLLAVT